MKITHINSHERKTAVPRGPKQADFFYNACLEAVVDGLRAEIDLASKTGRTAPEPVAHHVAMSLDFGLMPLRPHDTYVLTCE